MKYHNVALDSVDKSCTHYIIVQYLLLMLCAYRARMTRRTQHLRCSLWIERMYRKRNEHVDTKINKAVAKLQTLPGCAAPLCQALASLHFARTARAALPDCVLRLLFTFPWPSNRSNIATKLKVPRQTARGVLILSGFRAARWLATHLSPRALISFASLRKSKICGLTSSIKPRAEAHFTGLKIKYLARLGLTLFGL